MKKNRHFSTWFTHPAGRVFGVAAGIRTTLYDRGTLPVTQAEKSVVISVGNIAVGGRGKTPLAQFVAGRCAEWGFDAALLLRGYKGTLEQKGGLVSRGNGPLVSPLEAGDEAYLAAALCSGVTVRVGKNRSQQVWLAQQDGAQVMVLDDGFQHRALARHVDIVCIAPEDTAPGARFIPAGPLREKKEGLARATLLAGYSSDWKQRDDGPPLRFKHVPVGLLTPAFKPLPLQVLPESVHLLTGVAVPTRVCETVTRLNTRVVSTSFFGDHHCFRPDELLRVQARAMRHGGKAILTTAKDLPRLPPMSLNLPVFGLHTRLEIISGLEALESTLRSVLAELSHQ